MKKFLCFSTIITTILLIVAMPNLYSKAADMTITTEGTTTIPVTADVSAVFEVTFPSEITITNYNVKEFEIRGNGSISAYEYLEIALPDTITMSCEGEYNENLKITMSDTKFTKDQLASNSVITCGIDASTLSSGEWSGNLDVTISIKDLYYRLPDTISYNRPYTTVVKAYYSGDVYIYNHEKPLYYHEPSGGYTSGTITAKDMNNDTWYELYGENEGIWTQQKSATFSLRSGGSSLDLNQYEIIYCNYDILKASTSELWQTRLCP